MLLGGIAVAFASPGHGLLLAGGAAVAYCSAAKEEQKLSDQVIQALRQLQADWTHWYPSGLANSESNLPARRKTLGDCL